MATSDVLMWLNILLVLVLLLVVARGQGVGAFWTSPTTVIVEEDVVGSPGPTFSSSTEVGVDLLVKPVSPSWPYTEFPRRSTSAGSVAWKQSSLDSAPYYTGKLRPLEWSVPRCHSCHSKSPSLREGLETNVAVEDQSNKAVVEGATPPAQTTKKPMTELPEKAATPAASDTPAAPAVADQKDKSSSSAEPQAPKASATEAATKASVDQAPAPAQPQADPKTRAVSIGGADSLKSTAVNTLVPQTSEGQLWKAPATTKMDGASANADANPDASATISVAEKKPVLPANALTETVQQRLQLLGDLGNGNGVGGEMAQPLYLLTLLQQNQQRSQELGKEMKNNGGAAATTTTTTTTSTTAPAEKSRVEMIPA